MQPARLRNTLLQNRSAAASVAAAFFLMTAITCGKNTVCIVDDDAEIRELLSAYLRRHGFATATAGDAESFFQLLASTSCDLVVLDIMLPGADGYEIFRRLRAVSCAPVIFLTALGNTVDRIVGLELGADDYLGKPFEPRELLARIRTVLRRAGDKSPAFTASGVFYKAASGGEGPEGMLRFAGWTLDAAARRLIAPDGVAVHLSGAEFRLLQVFLRHPQQVLTRDALLEQTQGRHAAPFDRSIDVQVSRLRIRLRDNGREARIIKTVRGDGYVLAAEVGLASVAADGGDPLSAGEKA